MRKILYIALVALTVCGCDKQSDNGDLDGMWQFLTVSYHSALAEEDSIVDIKAGKVYLSFQLDLAQIKSVNLDLDPEAISVLMRFDHSGDRLTLYDFYHHYRTADSLFTDADSLLLAPLGIKGSTCDFTVQKLNSQSMELSSDYADITFRKF